MSFGILRGPMAVDMSDGLDALSFSLLVMLELGGHETEGHVISIM